MSTAVAGHAVQDWLSKLNALTEIRDSQGKVLGYYTPADHRETKDEIEKQFLALALLWKHGQGPGSSLSQMIAHPAYLQIISLGKAALPLLLRNWPGSLITGFRRCLPSPEKTRYRRRAEDICGR